MVEQNWKDKFHLVNFHQIFSDNCFCLSKRLGIDLLNNFTPIAEHTYIIFGAHDQAVQLYSIQQQNPTIKYIIINSEPPQSNHLKNKYFLSIMRGNIVFDYHPISSKHLLSLGIRVFSQYVFENVYSPSNAPREIDLLFVGSRSPRREALYKKLIEKYPNKNIRFEMDWGHSDQLEMTKLLQNAKFVLNVPYYESGILESHRIHKALSCGCEVISLYSGDKQTDDFYEPYVHFCHDIFELLDEDEPETKQPKKKYTELIVALAENVAHNGWIIEQLGQHKN
jgi:hypothetical protein